MKKCTWILALTLLFAITSCSSDDSTPDITKAFLGLWNFDYEESCPGLEPDSGIQDLEIVKVSKGKIELTFEDGTTFEADVTSDDFAVINIDGYLGSIEVVDGDLEISFSLSTCFTEGIATPAPL